MKSLIVIAVLLTSLSTQAQVAAQYKGYEKINKVVYQNVLNSTGSVPAMSFFIQEYFSNFNPGLIGLMGYYPNGINNGEMANGNPNSVSYLIYYLVFSEMAKKLQADCAIIDTPNVKADYQESFLADLKSLCASDLAQPLDDSLMEKFWVHFHSFQAPYDEMLAWKDFINAREFNSSADRVHDMALTVTLNPFFMIEN